MTRRPTLVVVGYPTRLVSDHATLLAAADAAGFDAQLVSPGRLAVAVTDQLERVLVDGEPFRPDVVLPRGVNRPWPFIRQVLEVWQRDGVHIAPSLSGADLCADKLTTTRVLAAAGVPVLPTIGVVPDDGVRITPLRDEGPLVIKPARSSKGRGVARFDHIDEVESALGHTRPLQAGMVDHHVVQPRASEWGVDYRVVVAWNGHG
jgi:glutathione synthase/RimK-type ligase-like ATP-grasp enzyme